MTPPDALLQPLRSWLSAGDFLPAGRSTDCGKYLGICYGAVSFDNIVKEDIFMFEAFYEKYAPEEQEVVALIRNCIGGGYNNKGDFWEMTAISLGLSLIHILSCL